MKLVAINPDVKQVQINHLNKLLAPLGFVNHNNFMFYHPEYKAMVDFSAIDKDKAVEYAVNKIYYAGLNFGIESTQRVIRNALGMDK
jgi:hypothetical protein